MTDPVVPEEKKDPAGVAIATPAQSVGAADKQSAVAGGASGDAKSEPVVLPETQAALDAQRAKYEEDINKLRSSLESGAAKRQQAADDRLKELQANLDALATKDMDDAQRAVYERNAAVKRSEELEQALEEAQQQSKQLRTFQDTLSYFTANGVPANVLDRDNGVEGLARSAWEWALGGKGKSEDVKPKPKTPVAPDVQTDGAGGIAHKNSMSELIKAQAFPGEHPEATERRIFDMISTGALPPTILPVGN